MTTHSLFFFNFLDGAFSSRYLLSEASTSHWRRILHSRVFAQSSTLQRSSEIHNQSLQWERRNDIRAVSARPESWAHGVSCWGSSLRPSTVNDANAVQTYLPDLVMLKFPVLKKSFPWHWRDIFFLCPQDKDKIKKAVCCLKMELLTEWPK